MKVVVPNPDEQRVSVAATSEEGEPVVRDDDPDIIIHQVRYAVVCRNAVV
jgi:hypothetical protein